MSDLTRPGAWWAPSSKHAKRTALGTAAIVIALALITWTVWASPSSPVSTAVHHALGVKTSADKVADAKKLQTQLTAAQQQVWKLEGQLKSLTASKDSRGDQITQLKSQIASLQSQLGAAKASAAGSAAKTTTTGGSGSGTSGSGSSGGSGGSAGNPTTVVAGNGNGTSSEGSTPPVAVPTKASILAQSTRWFGLYTDQSPFNWAAYDDISNKVGESPNLAGYFQGFDQDFRADAVQRSWANGRLPMLTWESQPNAAGNDEPEQPDYSLSKIIDGSFDAYLTKYAQAVKANGQPLAIRFDHEMNGNWYPWSEGVNGNSYENNDYVAAWQHVWNVFQANGANDDVIWVWSPSRVDRLPTTYSSAFDHTTLDYTKSLYPGDQYVDWMGMSGYYRPPYDDKSQPTFQNTFGRTLAQLEQVSSKPIILAEIGASETGGTTSNGATPAKVQWINDLFNNLADPANSRIIGFVYFNEVATTVLDGERTTNDWRLDSRSDTLAAFKAGISRKDTDYDLKEIAQ